MTTQCKALLPARVVSAEPGFSSIACYNITFPDQHTCGMRTVGAASGSALGFGRDPVESGHERGEPGAA